MKITESQIRHIVRKILISELEGWKPNFGRSSGGGGGGGYAWDDYGDLYSMEDPWGDEGGDDGGDLGEVDEDDEAGDGDE
jgi:hypothetical protein